MQLASGENVLMTLKGNAQFIISEDNQHLCPRLKVCYFPSADNSNDVVKYSRLHVPVIIEDISTKKTDSKAHSNS